MKRLTLAAFVVLTAACSGPVATRSTVQIDAIAKSDLDGTWYFRQTVVGTPYTTGFTFIGEQGENEMEKIVWDIEEDVLYARRSYEYIKGTEIGEPAQHSGADGGYQGAPVAAFKIKSQFDIIREYNASTGEEYDKVIESQERKWFERKFIRVDWSTNLVSNFNFLADWGGAGGVSAIKTDPVPYYVSDPKDPDALRLERPSKDEAANYLEITQKMIASPEMVTDYDGYSFPLCFAEYTLTDCASQEIRVRSSFLKTGARDFEPEVYDDKMMEKFGYFTTERRSYNRQYGVTETGRQRMINRHNIWQHTLTQTACTKNEQCGTAAGARCVTEIPEAKTDPTTGVTTGVCSLPYAVRNLENPSDPGSKDLGPRQIVYYLNDSFPADLHDAAKSLEKQYDDIFRNIVTELTGKAPAFNVFRVCLNNPVGESDFAECGPAGTHPRIGDLRYNMLYWIDEPTVDGLLGYGPNSNDPETGETISSVAFIYGADVDDYSAYARDLVRLVNGEIAPDKFITGVDVQAWVNSTQAGTKSKSVSQKELDEMTGRMDLSWTHGLPKNPAMRPASVRGLHAQKIERSKALAASPVLKGSPGLVARRLKKLEGTDVEAMLVDKNVLMMRGINPGAPGSQANAATVRPLALFNPGERAFRKNQRRNMGAHGVDFATLDDTVLGFALAQKGADPQLIWKKIREQVFLSTALHEVGHTVGLRHNFSGSYDPMNYPKTYWDLRTAGGTLTPQPRHLLPESAAELAGVTLPNGLHAGISEFMQSSIMDYGANFNSDIQGLGKYDVAALKFGYGNLVEVFTDVKDPYLVGALQASSTYGEAMPLLVDCAGNNFIGLHYTKLPSLVTLESRVDVPRASLHNEVLVKTCPAADVVEIDAMNRLTVPYKFCSDEFEGASTGCEMFDRGADPFEVASSKINNYRNYYIFDAFRRDRLGFNPEWYLDRLYGRYLETLHTMMQFYVLDRSYYADSIPDDGKPTNFWHAADGYGAYTVAVTQGFDFFGEVLTMPEPGPYYNYSLNDDSEAWQMDDYGTGAPGFRLGLGQSRYFNTEWEYDSGYFWYERVRNVGSFSDKVAVIAEMTDPETYFIGKDVSADVRQYAINYWRLFPKQMLDVFSAAMTDRWDKFAPSFDGTKINTHPISAPIPALKAGEAPIEPMVGFTVQLWMSSLSSALLPGTYDSSYQDSARLWVAGTGSQITTTLPTVSFVDPYSGKNYTAISYKQGTVETGVAARMIARANDLKSRVAPASPWIEATLKSYLQFMEAHRSITEIYSNPIE